MSTFDASARGAPFTLDVGSLAPGELSVVSFRGREGLSRLYAFDVLAACSAERASQSEALLGQTATLGVEVPDREPRRITGIVAAVGVESTQPVFGTAALRVRLVPRMWLLRRSRNSRIFQDLTVEQILTRVLADLRVPCAFRLRAQHRPKPYCVQHHESDFDFATRIAAEEGLFFSFSPGDPDGREPWDRVVFADSADYPSIGELPGDAAIPFRPESGLARGGEAITAFAPRRRARSASVFLKDYDFQRPLLDLTAEAVAEGDPPGHGLGRGAPQVYHPVSDYEDPEVRRERADVLLSQLRRDAVTARGQSSTARLVPGSRFELSGHPDETLHWAHAVTRVEHEGRLPDRARGASGAESEPVYRNTFECVPAHVPYRPRRPSRAPRQVMETALVVGPPGETVYTDKLGRIKVQFHWDREGLRNEHASCWLRVSQAWAGPSWGFQFIPRVGMEVLVSFVGGDPDRPVVTGCLYNPVCPPTHELPQNATKSGIRTRTVPGDEGHNEVSFEDRRGQEMLHLHAERDMSEVVKNDQTITVGRFDPESPTGDRRIRVARDQRVEIGGNRVAKVSGNQEETIAGERSVTVEGGDLSVVRGQRADEVDAFRQRTLTTHELEIGGDAQFQVAGQAIHRTGGNRLEAVGGDAKTKVAGYANLSVQGDYAVNATLGITLTSATGIRLVCGESSIDVGPREIVMTSPTITVGATRTAAVIAEGVSLHLEDRKAALSASERVELFARGSEVQLDEAGVKAAADKDIRLFSKGASVVLDTDAKMDGSTVMLNCGGTSESPEEREPDELEVSWVEIELLRPVPKEGDPTQVEQKGVPGARYVVKAGEGREYRGTLDGEGRARIAVPPGPVDVSFPDHDQGRIKPK